MKQMETIILHEITKIDEDLKAEIVGSYRRGTIIVSLFLSFSL